jgi:hypothetical protein
VNRLSKLQWTVGVLLVAGFSAGSVAYTVGRPGWEVLLIFAMAPLLISGWMLFSGRWRRYRFLVYAALPALVVGGIEAWQDTRLPESLAESLDLPESPGEPDLFFEHNEHNLPGVLMELYPTRPETLFIQGFQLKLCYDDLVSQRTPPDICRQFGDVDLQRIRGYFETALAQQAKHDENLYYHYVEILIRLREPQAAIDAASAEWRRQFPFSHRRDPREVFRAS